MNWFDSHCHLKSFSDKGTLDEILVHAKSNLVNRLTAVGTSLEDWNLYQNLSQKYSGFVYYSVGLHPCYVDEKFEIQIEQIEPFIGDEIHPVALGEIGLDYFHLPKDKSSAKALVDFQKVAFSKQLDLAIKYDLPIIVHSRNSFSDCIKILESRGVNWNRVLFHCFSEGIEEIRLLNDRGGQASFTGILTYKKNDSLREAAMKQGLENLILETDSPYLTPEPKRGKSNKPGYLRHLGNFISEKYNIKLEELAHKTFCNTNKFYNIN